MNVSISRNDDEATVDFYADTSGGRSRRCVRADVPFANVAAVVAELRGVGHRVFCTGVVARKLAAAGADVSGTERPE